MLTGTSRYWIAVFVFCTGVLFQLPNSAADGSQEDAISDISIEGNRRIPATTIEHYLRLERGQPFSLETLVPALERLENTGYFDDIDIGINGTALVISVVEAPTVNDVKLSGEHYLDTSMLLEVIDLPPRAAASRDKIEQSLTAIKAFYFRQGKPDVTVQAKVRTRLQNRVDLLLEIKDQPAPTVGSLNFTGMKKFREACIIEKSKIGNGFVHYDAQVDVIHHSLEKSVQRLINFYGERGYVEALVYANASPPTNIHNARDVTFKITEGKQFTVGEVTVKNTLAAELPALDEQIHLRRGEILRQSEIKSTIFAIYKKIRRETGQLAHVEFTTTDATADGVKNVTFLVSKLPDRIVDRIEINGNIRTMDAVIRRMISVTEQLPLDPVAISESAERIYRTGFFKSVNVRYSDVIPPNKRIVVFTVEELSTGRVNADLGWIDEFGPAFRFGIAELNFLGRGTKLIALLHMHFGGVSAEFSLTDPNFMYQGISGKSGIKIDIGSFSSLLDPSLGFGIVVWFGLFVFPFPAVLLVILRYGYIVHLWKDDAHRCRREYGTMKKIVMTIIIAQVLVSLMSFGIALSLNGIKVAPEWYVDRFVCDGAGT